MIKQQLFPLFMDIQKMPILLVGAGEVAARKAEKLLQFVDSIDCVAPVANDEMKRWIALGKINWQARKFEETDLIGKKIVIVAADDLDLQKNIFRSAGEMGILVNSVDSPDYCHFIFPALVVRDQLVVGISTGGAAPSVSSAIRQQIEKMIPTSVDHLISQVQQMRESLKKSDLTTTQRGQKIVEFVRSQFKSPSE